MLNSSLKKNGQESNIFFPWLVHFCSTFLELHGDFIKQKEVIMYFYEYILHPSGPPVRGPPQWESSRIKHSLWRPDFCFCWNVTEKNIQTVVGKHDVLCHKKQQKLLKRNCEIETRNEPSICSKVGQNVNLLTNHVQCCATWTVLQDVFPSDLFWHMEGLFIFSWLR